MIIKLLCREHFKMLSLDTIPFNLNVLSDSISKKISHSTNVTMLPQMVVLWITWLICSSTSGVWFTKLNQS